MTKRKFWLGVASGAHVDMCVRTGRCIFGHGEATHHEAMRRGDGVAFYAPREEYKAGARIQEFVAVGVFATDRISIDRELHARSVRWRKKVTTAPIRPLLERLDFTKHLGTRWGTSLRRAVREISARDFARICRAMDVDPPK